MDMWKAARMAIRVRLKVQLTQALLPTQDHWQMLGVDFEKRASVFNTSPVPYPASRNVQLWNFLSFRWYLCVESCSLRTQSLPRICVSAFWPHNKFCSSYNIPC